MPDVPEVPDIIRIRTTLTSDTLHLPILAPLIGRSVEIVVYDQPLSPTGIPLKYPWPTPGMVAIADAALESLRNSTYDWDAWKDQREIDRRHEEEELRKWQERPSAEGEAA